MTPPPGGDAAGEADDREDGTARTDSDESRGDDLAESAGDRDGQRARVPADQRIDPSEAFAALSDPLRVDILRELAAVLRESGSEPVGFAALRKRVGVRDSGRFRYHLNELRDRFVRKVEGGYRLTNTGHETVAAILAGTYTHDGGVGPEPLDSDCPDCGTAAVAVYRDGRCGVTCANDHPLFGWSLPPAAAADATLTEAVALAELLARQAIERTLAGICPKCSAPVEPRIVLADADSDRSDPDLPDDAAPSPPDGADPPDDADPDPRLRARCDTCGGRLVGPVGFCLLVDPAVEAFYRRHGRPLDDAHVWEPAFVADDDAVSVVDRDPLRVAVDVTLDGETLAVTVDESGQVAVREG